jgi:hypothetical protein
MNLDPTPTIDSTEISPHNAFARFLQIVKPKPTPSKFSSLFYIILLNAWNIIFFFYSSMPTPESMTDINKVYSLMDPVILTNPLGVYLIAFDRRLIIICLNLFSSERYDVGKFSSNS